MLSKQYLQTFDLLCRSLACQGVKDAISGYIAELRQSPIQEDSDRRTLAQRVTRSYLHIAAKNNYTNALDFFVKDLGCDMQAKDRQGRTAQQILDEVRPIPTTNRTRLITTTGVAAAVFAVAAVMSR